MKKQSLVVEQAEEKVPAKIMAQEIVNIGQAMKAMSKSRLKRDAVVTLVHDKTKIPKYKIELVMNNLEQLEETWLK